jgi:hypothetical protein
MIEGYDDYCNSSTIRTKIATGKLLKFGISVYQKVLTLVRKIIVHETELGLSFQTKLILLKLNNKCLVAGLSENRKRTFEK